MKLPRLLLAGTHSGVGKTTVTLGLLAALRCRGLGVQPFKVGPDYIDPGLHQVAAGRSSHNLDSWMGTSEEVRQLFVKHARGSDLALIEGVMGLYDGARGQGERGSTAQVAKLTGSPVVLIFSAKGLARSAAALIKGYQVFDPQVSIVGVIANGVGSQRHRGFLKDAIEGELGLPLLGAIGANNNLTMPQRHLGLLPAMENQALTGILDQLADCLAEQVDLAKLLALAEEAPPLVESNTKAAVPKTRVKLAVAMDEAFNFYYQDSLDFLRELGAELVTFSPLRDSVLPADIDGIYIGGGFPEEFLPALSLNKQLKQQVKSAHQKSMPIYAECGGLMYLCREIYNRSGDSYPGVELVPAVANMGTRLTALGYVEVRILQTSLLGQPGVVFRGHEFHWSHLNWLADTEYCYSLTGGRGESGRLEGFVQGNLLASYVHLHFRHNPTAALSFLSNCARYQEIRRMSGN